MTSGNTTAEIFDMEDARARRRASALASDGFEHVGAHLAAVREASGYSLSEAAGKTHIKETHLSALESLDTAQLPPRAYAIGFVKTYAEFLELDPGDIVDRFKQDAGFSTPPSIETEKFEPAHANQPHYSGELSLPAVFAIIAFFIWCAWQITLIDSETPAAALNGAAITGAPRGEGPVLLNAVDPSLTHNKIEVGILDRVEPVFPRICLDSAKPQERVTIAFNITAAGNVSGERVLHTTNACFDRAALNAIRRWRFAPSEAAGGGKTFYDQRMRFLFERPL